MIKTMEYKGKLLSPAGSHKKGDVVRLSRKMGGAWYIISDGLVIPKSSVRITSQIYDNSAPVDKADAENFVSSISSQTKWLLWFNKWTMRGYLFYGEKGSWELKKIKRGTCGSIEHGQGSDTKPKKNYKFYSKYYKVNVGHGNQYFGAFMNQKNGGNSIHYRPGATKMIPASHGCVCFGKPFSKYLYKKIPVNTRVVVF